MIVSAAAIALLIAAPALQSQAVPSQPRALEIRYVDGQVIGPKGRVSWTPVFPRVAGADTSRDGLPLFALQFEVEGDPQPAASESLLNAGTTLQLDRAVAVLIVDVTDDEAEAARHGLANLDLIPLASARSTMQSGMQNVKNAMANDIDEWVLKGGSVAEYEAWLRVMVRSTRRGLAASPGRPDPPRAHLQT